MGLCTKESLWHLSLLLFQHLKENGLVAGLFVWDEICSVSDAVSLLFRIVVCLYGIDE